MDLSIELCGYIVSSEYLPPDSIKKGSDPGVIEVQPERSSGSVIARYVTIIKPKVSKTVSS